MNRSARRAALLSAPLLAAALLAGCGGSSAPTTTASPAASTTASASPTTSATKPTAGELFKQAKAAALAAKSARVAGEMSLGGKQATLDIAGDMAGTNQKMLMSQTGIGKFELLTVDGKYYMKADDAFWTANAGKAAAGMVANKQVLLPADKAKAMGDFTLGSLIQKMFSGASASAVEASTAPVTETTLDGKPAYVLSSKPGEEAELLVSADGKAQILAIKGPAKDPGLMKFSEWDAVAPFAAPAASDIVTLPGS